MADQHLATLARELDDANASLAKLHAEHAKLRDKLGYEAPPATTVVRAVEKPGADGGGYRGADAATAMEAALAKANAAVANLGIENEMMRSRLDERSARAAKAWKAAFVGVATVGVVLVVAYLTVGLLPPKLVSAVLPLMMLVLGFRALTRRSSQGQ